MCLVEHARPASTDRPPSSRRPSRGSPRSCGTASTQRPRQILVPAARDPRRAASAATTMTATTTKLNTAAELGSRYHESGPPPGRPGRPLPCLSPEPWLTAIADPVLKLKQARPRAVRTGSQSSGSRLGTERLLDGASTEAAYARARLVTALQRPRFRRPASFGGEPPARPAARVHASGGAAGRRRCG